MTHCIRYMSSYMKQECRVKKGLAPNKSFRKTFGEKEGNSDGSGFSKNLKSQQVWYQSCKSNQVDMHDQVKAQPDWQLRVSPDEKNKI